MFTRALEIPWFRGILKRAYNKKNDLGWKEKERTAAWSRRSAVFFFFFSTAGLKKSCKNTQVNEIKSCAETQAKCIWKAKQQPFQLVGSASMEKQKTGERERLKKRYTYTFSDSMVLQKVLMAIEVEQHQFTLILLFAKTARKVYKTPPKLSNKSSSNFFLHVQIHIQICLPQFSTSGQKFFFWYFSLNPACIF